MPSPQPINPSPSADVQTPSTLAQNGNTIHSESDGMAEELSLANGSSQNPRPADQQAKTAIEEAKEKAKAVMVASGLSAPTTTEDTVMVEGEFSAVPRATSSDAVNDPASGSSRSRKRSRSGTRITQIPREPMEGVPIRVKDSKHNVLLENYVRHDQTYFSSIIAAKEGETKLIASKKEQLQQYREVYQRRLVDPGQVFGSGYMVHGPQQAGQQKPRFIYPAERKRPGGMKTKELRVSKKDRVTQADQIDELVPIRLDIESDKIRLRDTFTWNIHDRVVDPKLFAQQLVEDLHLPLETCGSLVTLVASSLQDQIRDYHPHIFIDEGALDPHLPYHAYKNDDMRIVIKLNITIGQHTLIDQFEWDINNPMNMPEEFARQMARDLSLSGEFITAIAHSIREQCQLFTRSLYITGHPFDGRPVEDPELRASFLPSPLGSSFRPYQAAKEFTPIMYELNEADLEKTELSLSREERRQKRSVNRRGGPVLPDLKDRRSTIRTLVVSSVLPGAAETLEDSRIFKRTVAASGRNRRSGLGTRDGDDSADSESEDSSPDSPAIPSHLLAGTARTRGMRGAASAAQAAMRANVGRSATPESAIVHHHETRTSGRRTGGREYREESSVDPPTTLIVKLRIPRVRFQQFLKEQKAKEHGTQLRIHAANARPSSSANNTPSTPVKSSTQSSMGPPQIIQQQQQQQQPQQQAQQQQRPVSTAPFGRVDAVGVHGGEHPTPPPPPEFLINALTELKKSYPQDLFEGTMRFTAVSIETNQTIALRPGTPTFPPPPGTKFYYYPRIRCIDCPGKLYTPGPDQTVENFEVHLKNRTHREKVTRRLQGLPNS